MAIIDQVFEQGLEATTGLSHLGGGMHMKIYNRPTGQTPNVWFDLEPNGFEQFVPVGIQGVLSYDTRPDVRVNTTNWFVAKPAISSGKVEALCNLASTDINLIVIFYLKIT